MTAQRHTPQRPTDSWHRTGVIPETTTHVSRTYSRIAFLYDAWTFFTERRSLEEALDEVGIRDGEAVLEVAVGTGVLFREILARNPSGRNVGVDLTPAMLERARSKAARVGAPFELELGDATALPFADATFDVVINNNMMGVVPDAVVKRTVSELHRVLRPGGRLVIVTMKRPQRRLSEVVYQVGPVWLGAWRDVEVEPFVRAAGFLDITTRTVTQLGIPSEVLRATR